MVNKAIIDEQLNTFRDKGLAYTLKWDLGLLTRKFGSEGTVSFRRDQAGTVPAKRSVTAVIPNYNYERFLDERIDSILAQTYPVKELIILDDCSTDDSVQLIHRRIRVNQKKLEKTREAAAVNSTGEVGGAGGTDASAPGAIPIRLIRGRHNSGSVFKQWAKAFFYATGDFVWIAEADDSCNERFLETVMKSFEDPEVVISYTESATMDEKGHLLMGDLRPWIDLTKSGRWDRDYVCDGEQEVAESMCVNNTIANVSSVVFRNIGYDSVRPILEKARDYRLAGDWYTYMNLLRYGKIAYHSESLNYHRMQQQGLTLSTSHEEEFREICALQDYAMANFSVSRETRAKVYERRENERRRFGLAAE